MNQNIPRIQAVISGGAGGLKTAKTCLGTNARVVLLFEIRGKVGILCSSQHSLLSEGNPRRLHVLKVPQVLPGVLFPLENAFLYCRVGIGMERWTLSTKPHPAWLWSFSVPNFLFLLPRSLLSLSQAWSLMGKFKKKTLIKDIHVSPTNTVAEKRARTPRNMNLFPLPRHTLNQGCWGREVKNHCHKFVSSVCEGSSQTNPWTWKVHLEMHFVFSVVKRGMWCSWFAGRQKLATNQKQKYGVKNSFSASCYQGTFCHCREMEQPFKNHFYHPVPCVLQSQLPVPRFSRAWKRTQGDPRGMNPSVPWIARTPQQPPGEEIPMLVLTRSWENIQDTRILQDTLSLLVFLWHFPQSVLVFVWQRKQMWSCLAIPTPFAHG